MLFVLTINSADPIILPKNYRIPFLMTKALLRKGFYMLAFLLKLILLILYLLNKWSNVMLEECMRK